MKTVAVESPYAARFPFTIADHERYARLCMADALHRGEAPFLSHLLYTQTLDDLRITERAQGLAAGLAVSLRLDFAAMYYDLGITDGMARAIGTYREKGLRTELRRLYSPEVGRALRAGAITIKDAEDWRNKR